MKFPGFIGPSYTLDTDIVGLERLINQYTQLAESAGARGPKVFVPIPGVTTLTSVLSNPGRGIFELNGRLFAIIGYQLYELDDTWTATSRGDVQYSTDPVTISGNGDGGNELFITSNGIGFIYNLLTNTLTNVVTGATMGGFIDGYFIYLDTSTSKVYCSELFDGLTWDPGQVSQRNAAADKFDSMLIARREIWLFGNKTSEVWYNSGETFPFKPIPGAMFEFGIAARWSAAELGYTPVWLGQNKDGDSMVLRGVGYNAQRISNHGVERAIDSYSTKSDAIAWTYSDRGHSFYVLTFPTAEATWVFDDSTQEWHERAYWDVATSQFTAYRPQFHAHAFGTHVVLDRSNGNVYSLDRTSYSDVDGAVIRRVRRAPYLQDENKPIIVNRVEVEFNQGDAVLSGQGSEPIAMMNMAPDARVFKALPDVSVAPRGEYNGPRMIWRRCGRGTRASFELVLTDPIPWHIVDASIDVVVGK